MMRGIPFRILSLALVLASAVSLRAADPAVSEALPSALHVGALANLKAILKDMPRLGQEGLIAEKIEEFAAQGIPDPRTNLRDLAFGSFFGPPEGITEGIMLGTSDLQIVPIVRKIAAQDGISLTDSVYRGVAFVTGVFEQKATRFADPMENLMLMSTDQANRYRAADLVVDTIQGRTDSYQDTYSRGLTPGTFLTGRMVLSSEVRRSLSGTPLKNLAHLTGGSAEVKRGNGTVVMDMRATATSSIKASIALGMLRRKLQDIADQSSEPAVKRLLLEQTTLDRSGPTIKINTNSPFADFEAGAIALQKLIPAGMNR